MSSGPSSARPTASGWCAAWAPRCVALVVAYVAAAYVVSWSIGQHVAWLLPGMVRQASKIALLVYLPMVLAYVARETFGGERPARLARLLFTWQFHFELLAA